MHAFSYHDTVLMGESVALRDVAAEFGTPLYVYSKQSLIDRCRYIEGAFGGEEHLTYYAVKANANRSLLRFIAQEGLGADVGSKGELFLALGAGFSPGKITFSGVGKRDDEITYALDRGIHAFNVESKEEIEVLQQIAVRHGRVARVLLRVNLDIDAGGHAYISTSLKQNKFGVSRGRVVELLRWVQSLPHIEIRGIHSHIGSQILKLDTFYQAACEIVDLVQTIRHAGVAVHDVDFGGGFGVQYAGVVQHPSLPAEEPETKGFTAESLVKKVLPKLKETGCHVAIQPGRSIVAHAGVLLVKVLFRKQTDDKVFIVVDGGMNDLIRPSLYGSHHQIVPLVVTGAPFENVDVVGPLCESGDFFAQGRLLPQMKRGEYLALMCTGAYGYVLSSNYNARLRPAEVLIDGDFCTVIRERESLEDL